MTSYIIEDGESNMLTGGLTSRIEASRIAQSKADSLGETVYLSDEHSDDDPEAFSPDPLADLDPDEAEEIAGEWVIIAEWGDAVTDDEDAAACQRATEWCTEHEGPRLSLEFRPAHQDEAAGTYRRLANSNLQIHGFTLPVPDVISDLTNRAWQHACETWPEDDGPEEPSRMVARRRGDTRPQNREQQ